MLRSRTRTGRVRPASVIGSRAATSARAARCAASDVAALPDRERGEEAQLGGVVRLPQEPAQAALPRSAADHVVRRPRSHQHDRRRPARCSSGASASRLASMRRSVVLDDVSTPRRRAPSWRRHQRGLVQVVGVERVDAEADERERRLSQGALLAIQHQHGAVLAEGHRPLPRGLFGRPGELRVNAYANARDRNQYRPSPQIAAEPTSATPRWRSGRVPLERAQRRPHQRHDRELPELDADVEAEERGRHAIRGQLHLGQHAGEAEAVHQAEGEGDRRAQPRRPRRRARAGRSGRRRRARGRPARAAAPTPTPNAPSTASAQQAERRHQRARRTPRPAEQPRVLRGDQRDREADQRLDGGAVRPHHAEHRQRRA